MAEQNRQPTHRRRRRKQEGERGQRGQARGEEEEEEEEEEGVRLARDGRFIGNNNGYKDARIKLKP